MTIGCISQPSRSYKMKKVFVAVLLSSSAASWSERPVIDFALLDQDWSLEAQHDLAPQVSETHIVAVASTAHRVYEEIKAQQVETQFHHSGNLTFKTLTVGYGQFLSATINDARVPVIKNAESVALCRTNEREMFRACYYGEQASGFLEAWLIPDAPNGNLVFIEASIDFPFTKQYSRLHIN
jgi:hypothetical protein